VNGPVFFIEKQTDYKQELRQFVTANWRRKNKGTTGWL